MERETIMSNENKFASRYNDPLAWYRGGLNKSKENETGITAEAIDKVRNDRQELYGHPKINFGRIARFWNDYLELTPAHRITDKDVAFMMILVKIAREMHKTNRDNLIDIIGYVQCLELLDALE